MSTRRSPIALVPALLVVVVSLWETCAARRDAAAVPDDAAWQRAAAVVRAQFRAGDLIVFAPEWVDPVGRMHLGDLISVDDAARMDAAKYARVWELAIRGAHAADVKGEHAAFEDDSGGVAVRRYDRTPPVHVLADVRALLAGARVDGGAARLELAEVGFAPHRCVQIEPLVGKPVRITFPALRLGKTLVGYGGLADVFTRRDIRAPGKLAVEVGGATAAMVEPGVDDGWLRFEIATTPGAADVTFVASADAPRRLICFAAEARE